MHVWQLYYGITTGGTHRDSPDAAESARIRNREGSV